MFMRHTITIPAALAAMLICGQIQAEERVETIDGWEITIAPDDKAPVVPVEQGTIDPTNYQRIYDSIPFNRTEYNANPSYRHDTAMEIMFGKMRKTVILRHMQPTQPTQTTHLPRRTVRSPRVAPYRYNGGLRRYGVGYYMMWNARGLY